MSSDFIERLQHGPVLCDGAMGTQLHAHGVTFDHSLDGLNLTQPEIVLNVHRGYVEAGADLLETNTFGGNRFRLHTNPLQFGSPWPAIAPVWQTRRRMPSCFIWETMLAVAGAQNGFGGSGGAEKSPPSRGPNTTTAASAPSSV